ncbi:unnamed protein product [Rotaria sordida]|uniref:G-protein coupled receptors family 1 profile domain-containing protein n=1 Tax=Rotaria sordida TaxID=392033 RepID=A0A813WBY7_9BILA|nr:unnamed protein product [Rotaria sordida]CAF0844489.1 unnamed protein product [Rotaria sordida]CAF0853027.1 unnamed protein product [Rotaria sordida]CAF3984549.1 unnamed protein product [Rotaria sordida]CAF4000201.1 unnamed protein product [Rotaria sordida]
MSTSTIKLQTTTSCTDILQQSRYHNLILYLPNTEYLLIFLFQLIIVFSIVNNLLTIQTCLRLSIRITNLGVYLILLSLSNLIRCIFLQTSLICDTQSLQRTALFYVSAISLNILNFSAMCYSSMIACERLFIECFNYPFYATRQRSCLFSIILLIITLLTQIPTVLLYFSGFSASIVISILTKIVKSIEFGTVLITCFLHIVSSLFVLKHISVHKVYINLGEQEYWCVWRQQMKNHMDFFIPPLCYILCILPWYLFKHVIYSCDRVSPTTILRLYFILIALANVPFTMTFLIYIYPSNVYMNEFRRSLAVLTTKIFIYGSHRKRTDSDMSNVTKISSIA